MEGDGAKRKSGIGRMAVKLPPKQANTYSNWGTLLVGMIILICSHILGREGMET